MLGERIDAREADRIGLVTRLVAREELEAETYALARRLATGPTAAFRYIKRALNLAETASPREVLDAELYGMMRCSQTEDARELTVATKEGRHPVFKGF
jgi:2-(1,2-epoxy-1,2-dihydrophenyl)acetyl-CoA isomerase